MRNVFFLLLVFGSHAVMAQKKLADNIVIVTMDGFRWQELFGGADETLLNDKTFTLDSGLLKKNFWAGTKEESRKKLMPFFWNTIATKGQVYGNKAGGSSMQVSNRYRFSYPGYNEIFTGYPDTLVNSNDKILNPNINVLEFLNQQNAFKNRVAAFTSWDVFDAILNEKRAGFLVSSGFDSVHFNTPAFRLLNDMQMHSPYPLGQEIRPDHLTYFLAKEFLKTYKPKVLYIGFDETDDNAHQGSYDRYMHMANMTDNWLQDLWSTLQSMPQYKNNTILLVTSDHGRGDKIKSEWTSHGKDIEGAQDIWMAVMGPGITAKGVVKNTEPVYQAQLAQTIAAMMGYTFKAPHPVAPLIKQVFEK